MPFQKTEISGVQLFRPTVFEDSRGAFFESFKSEEICEEFGPFVVEQMNNSVSRKGVIRGVHFKRNPPGQVKFVSVHFGAIFDVVIDLRKSSPTFQEWQGFLLSAENKQSLLIGNGVGHAFLSLETGARVSYLCNSPFEPEKEFNINPMNAGIDWAEVALAHGISKFDVSERDQGAPALADSENLWFE